MYKKLIAASAVSASVAFSGCAAFRANDLPAVDKAEVAVKSATKTKVFSRWSIESDSSLVNDQTRAAAGAIHKNYFDAALKESDCCIVVEGPTEADIVVNGKAINENNPAAVIPAFITGFSLFTIPSWATVTIHIQAEAKSGLMSRNYDLSDSITMVNWLPMIFVLPFADNPISAGKAVDENTYRTLVLKMKQDGFFNKS